MANGFKTGGRKAGTPNKRTEDLSAHLEKLGCDPVEGLARIASDESASLELRARCFSDLLPYIYPKRKALEATVQGVGEQTVMQVSFVRSAQADAEFKEWVEQEEAKRLKQP